jgi:hypothetical protein
VRCWLRRNFCCTQKLGSLGDELIPACIPFIRFARDACAIVGKQKDLRSYLESPGHDGSTSISFAVNGFVKRRRRCMAGA